MLISLFPENFKLNTSNSSTCPAALIESMNCSAVKSAT